MHLTINQAALLAALTRTARIVEKSQTIPILANVLLEADGGTLKITATDLDMAVCVAAAAKVDKPGAATVNAKTLHDIVRRLADGCEIRIDDEGEQGDREIVVRGGRSRFKLLTLPPGDFPSFETINSAASFDLAAGEITRLFERVERAIANDEARYYLNGVFLHMLAADDGATVLRAVATNGHILSLAQAVLETPCAAPGVIVPVKAVREIKRLADGHTGALRLSVSPTKIEAVAGDTVLISKLIDWTFPDYARVIPSGATKIATADVQPLRDAVERVAILGANDKGYGSRIALSFSDGRLELQAHNAEGGSADEDLPVDYDGPPITIAFAHKYLLAMLATLAGDTIRCELTDAGSPGVFRALEGAPELFVLMPQRV